MPHKSVIFYGIYYPCLLQQALPQGSLTGTDFNHQ